MMDMLSSRIHLSMMPTRSPLLGVIIQGMKNEGDNNKPFSQLEEWAGKHVKTKVNAAGAHARAGALRAKPAVCGALDRASTALKTNPAAPCIAAFLVLVCVVCTGASVKAFTSEGPLAFPSATQAQSAAEDESAAEGTAETSENEGETATAAANHSLEIAPTTLNAIPAQASEPAAFSLYPDAQAQALSTEELSTLQNLLTPFAERQYSVGFIAVNLQTGTGIAYNADTRIYGASSFKGPYCTYICEALIDGGQISRAAVDGSVESTIVWSDNESFEGMRNVYDYNGFAEWLAGCDVAQDIAEDTHFPRYSARDSAKLWLHTYQYLAAEAKADSGNYEAWSTSTEYWLRGLFAQTEHSFLRNGVSSLPGYSAQTTTVLNKGGWNFSNGASGDQRFNGLCDAGIVIENGQAYVVSVMTAAPDTGEYVTAIQNLAAAVYAMGKQR